MNKRVAYSMMLVGVFMLVGVGLLRFQPPQIIGGEADVFDVGIEKFTNSVVPNVDVSKIYGKIQIVKSFPDYRVEVVDSFPDLKVQVVNSFPDKPGKWQMVNSFPDFKIQLVDSFPDFKIKYVSSFPGKE